MGQPCPSFPVRESDFCVGHHPDKAAYVERSHESRRRNIQALKDNALPLRQLIAKESEKIAPALVARAAELALSKHDPTALRGLELLWSWHLGKPRQMLEVEARQAPSYPSRQEAEEVARALLEGSLPAS